MGGILRQFHQWVNGKEVLAGFDIFNIENNVRYYLLFIDWHRNSNFYLVVYMGNKSTTVCEIQNILTEGASSEIVWKYNPLKRDGKNAERKAYFKQLVGSSEIHIPLPTSSSSVGVEAFMDRLFRLCYFRLKADKVAEIFKDGKWA